MPECTETERGGRRIFGKHHGSRFQPDPCRVDKHPRASVPCMRIRWKTFFSIRRSLLPVWGIPHQWLTAAPCVCGRPDPP